MTAFTTPTTTPAEIVTRASQARIRLEVAERYLAAVRVVAEDRRWLLGLSVTEADERFDEACRLVNEAQRALDGAEQDLAQYEEAQRALDSN